MYITGYTYDTKTRSVSSTRNAVLKKIAPLIIAKAVAKKADVTRTPLFDERIALYVTNQREV